MTAVTSSISIAPETAAGSIRSSDRQVDGHVIPKTMAAALDMFAASKPLLPERTARIVADVRQAFLREPALPMLPPNGHDIKFVLKKLDDSKRGKNIRSHIRALLRWLHDILPSTKGPVLIGENWATLVCDPLLSMTERFSLTRFGRYCTLRGIEPGDVNDTVVGSFHAHMVQLGTVDNPRKLIVKLITTWTTASAKVDAFPRTTLSKLPRVGPPQRAPSLDQIEKQLAAEIRECTDWMGGDTENEGNIRNQSQSVAVKRFDLRLPHQGGPTPKRKTLKAATILSYGRYLRRSVRILSEADETLSPQLKLVHIVAPANVETIMCTMADELAAVGKGERSIQSAYCALSYVAKHYFKLCPEDLTLIAWLGEQLATPEPKLTKKNLSRLRELVLAKRFSLMRLPALLLNNTLRLIKAGQHQEKHLVDAQVAVAIAVLLSIPIRLGNLAAIRIGQHLHLSMKRGTEGRLQIPAEMVKNNLEIDRRIPVDIAEVLRAYIVHVLPLLRSNPSSTALFPGRKDDSCRIASGLGTQISRRIKEHIGVDMNAHLFRHFAAIMYLEEHPNEYEVVRLLLGNRNLETVKAYYTTVQNDAAIAKANGVVAEQKRRAGLNPNNMLDVVATAKRQPGYRHARAGRSRRAE